MDLSTVVLIGLTAGMLVGMRRFVPERPAFIFQNMFGYHADLGWPQGVQEDDGERAWVPREVPDWDPDDDELAWAAMIGTSTMSDTDGDRPLDRVALVKVHGDTSTAPRRGGPST